MSASEHEAAAKAHDREAAAHAAEYHPNASSSKTSCGGGSATKYIEGPCWTSSENPTAAHLKDADDHQKMAADHRAASKSLRDAEDKACVGLAASDRDESPFSHRDDIVSANKLEATVSSGKSTTSKLVGATVVVRAVPGLTKEYLQRAIDCHLARNAAMGFGMTEMAFCPLSVRGVRATVVSSGAGFGVELRTDDAAAATEVLKRATMLVPAS